MKTAEALAASAPILLLISVLVGVAAFRVTDRVALTVMLSISGAFLVLASLVTGARVLSRYIQAQELRRLADLITHDAVASFATDRSGAVQMQNRAAMERFGPREKLTLASTLGELFAEPRSVLLRLQGRASALGSAQEEVATRKGLMRISVHCAGDDVLLWRIEEYAETGGTRGPEATRLPMMTVSRSGTILFMNEALRRLIGARHSTIEQISEMPLVGGEERVIPSVDGPLRCVIAEIDLGAGRREIYLVPVASARTADDLTAFESLPVALMRLDTEGRISAANLAARALIGQIAENARLFDVFEGLGRPIEDWVRDALTGRADRRPEVMRVRRAEPEKYLQITLSRVVDNGQPGLVGVISDATQLKTLEAQFVQSQKMQAIGQLAGGVAHDFNNLLTAISGHCDLLMLRHDKGDPDYADLDQISQNANRAASLVGQLLAFSRKQTLKPKVIDLRDTLSDLSHLLNRLVGEKVMLTVSHDLSLPPIRADKRQLEQVIMNLVVNARDAMPRGGEIRIETEKLKLSQELSRDRACVPKGDYVVVRVIDEGIGIAPENLSKVFEPFYTTKRTGEGTGLGLSTAYGIVKQTGGYIFCDSVPGAGTTFSLYLPALDHGVEALAYEAPAPSVRAAAIEPGATVLLVEDETPVRAFASRALRLRGYSVLEAESGEEALKMLENNDLQVDAFVTDVVMSGLDGPSWVAQALGARAGTPVVFMSGYAEDVFTEGRAPIPNSVFLPKPFSLSELTATVQNQIAKCMAAA
ncbi:ATP-binding protein [Sedimentimonas flavescens]|uniref:histidine kinase n=1 Tax=Sedimentimonas flavescens TaxID=2851012 RepID=A0ABT2ZXZ0_9RHOB|nr:ATP-binding protein [Sedimentimonas flavescens]MCV2878462.1 ATP-binding protein [Sedimentimonas flavescens]